MKILEKTQFIFLLLLCFVKVCGQNKINVKRIDVNKLSHEIKYNGKIKNAITWTDKLGENFVLTCETGEYKTKNSEMDGRDSEIYAFHYIRNKTVVKQNWKIYDAIKDCPVDIDRKSVV